MSTVIIRRCPVCQTIGNEAEQVEAGLKNESGSRVEVIDGQRGEFTVLVDGKVVSRMEDEELPDVNDVVESVKRATHAGASA